MKIKFITATCDEYKTLLRIVKAADALEQWLGDNAGPTADYPIRITGTRLSDVNQMARRLDRLKDALTPFREVKS